MSPPYRRPSLAVDQAAAERARNRDGPPEMSARDALHLAVMESQKSPKFGSFDSALMDTRSTRLF